MGDIEFRQCDICMVSEPLSRKYYRYNIKCDCCNSVNDDHFEIVRYCSECEPKPPRIISVSIKPMKTVNKQI